MKVSNLPGGCQPTQTPTQKLKSVFSISGNWELEFGIIENVFVELNYLSFSHSRFIRWVQKS